MSSIQLLKVCAKRKSTFEKKNKKNIEKKPFVFVFFVFFQIEKKQKKRKKTVFFQKKNKRILNQKKQQHCLCLSHMTM